MATLEQRVADLEARLAALDTPTNAAVANQVAAYIGATGVRDDQFLTWLSGPVGGGPTGNGIYPLTDKSGFTRMVASPDQIRADALKFNGGVKTGAGPFPMTVAEAGRYWLIGNGNSTVNIQVRLPNAPLWTQYMFEASGSGRLVFSSNTGGTVRNRSNFTRSAGINAMCVAVCTAVDANGVSTWTLGGDLSSSTT